MDNFYEKRQAKRADPSSYSKLKELSKDFLIESFKSGYSYEFDWLGMPIIQYPEDICRVQELIWELEPDCIIETGIARGGSLTLSASILALLDLRDQKVGQTLKNRKVFGIDIDIREHNRVRLEKHFLADYMELVQGSSIDTNVFENIEKSVGSFKTIMVFLDSNHTHEHVLSELNLYSNLVTKGSYLVVFDTVAEFIGVNVMENRPWGVGNNPMTAVNAFLQQNDNFVVDLSLNNLTTISCNQRGFLKKISDT